MNHKKAQILIYDPVLDLSPLWYICPGIVLGIPGIQGLRVYAVTCRVQSWDCLRYPLLRAGYSPRIVCYVPGTVPGLS